MRTAAAIRAAVGTLVLGAGAAGCTTQQLYDSGQGWQREQCARLQDAAERERCRASTARSFDDYQAEAARSRSAAPR